MYAHLNRVINVIDLMNLEPPSEHPHGLSDRDFDALFTREAPFIFALHGYSELIHRLIYRRTNQDNLHLRDYKEKGTITMPFDMCVLNNIDRFRLVEDIVDRLPAFGARAAYVKQAMRDALTEHRQYIRSRGEDMPAVREWRWNDKTEVFPDLKYPRTYP